MKNKAWLKLDKWVVVKIKEATDTHYICTYKRKGIKYTTTKIHSDVYFEKPEELKRKKMSAHDKERVIVGGFIMSFCLSVSLTIFGYMMLGEFPMGIIIPTTLISNACTLIIIPNMINEHYDMKNKIEKMNKEK